MDWTVVVVLAFAGIFFLWRQSKNTEKAKAATERLKRDTRLYRNIKTGMREHNFREREQRFWEAADGELLFETAHLSAFHVDHFAAFISKTSKNTGCTASSRATATNFTRAITAPTVASKKKRFC
jgi:hypothetical protein